MRGKIIKVPSTALKDYLSNVIIMKKKKTKVRKIRNIQVASTVLILYCSYPTFYLYHEEEKENLEKKKSKLQAVHTNACLSLQSG